MPKDVHAMFGSGQHDIHPVGCGEEANAASPAVRPITIAIPAKGHQSCVLALAI